jgi:hypothetical protein
MEKFSNYGRNVRKGGEDEEEVPWTFLNSGIKF